MPAEEELDYGEEQEEPVAKHTPHSHASDSEEHPKRPTEEEEQPPSTVGKESSVRPRITYDEEGPSPSPAKRIRKVTPSPERKPASPAAAATGATPSMVDLPESLTRRKDASPARQEPTRFVHVRGLKRPFTLGQLHAMLGHFGTLDKQAFYIDGVKSNCIAKFETEEEAQRARDGIDGSAWTGVGLQDPLIAEYSSEEKLERRKADGEAGSVPVRGGLAGRVGLGASSGSITGGLVVTVENRGSAKDVDVFHETVSKPSESTPGKRERASVEPPDEEEEVVKEEGKTLEDIFRKTKTHPPIYFLPLTDEEAEERARRRPVKRSPTREHHQHHREERRTRRDSPPRRRY